MRTLLACIAALLLAGTVTAHEAGDGVRFVDRSGALVPLDAAHGSVPALLILGYAHCRDLCPLTLTGVVEALEKTPLVPMRDYRAIFASIDPTDDDASLARLRDERIPGSLRPAWTFVRGDARATERLLRAVGFEARREEDGTYAHPEGFVVVTPTGRVARYFSGVRFDSAALAQAVRDARSERIEGFVDRVLLICAHLDPAKGRYTVAILDALRVIALVGLVAGAIFWIRARA